jgi:hypothetical protein
MIMLSSHSQVVNILKKIIYDKNMLDSSNPVMVICSPDLEKALNMKAFHVHEIW